MYLLCLNLVNEYYNVSTETSLDRVYVWNTEGLYFSLDEALGFVRPSSAIFNSLIGL